MQVLTKKKHLKSQSEYFKSIKLNENKKKYNIINFIPHLNLPYV